MYVVCGAGKFQCLDGTCVDKKKVCNIEIDCSHEEDELWCNNCKL